MKYEVNTQGDLGSFHKIVILCGADMPLRERITMYVYGTYDRSEVKFVSILRQCRSIIRKINKESGK